jgi:hypothetical protein
MSMPMTDTMVIHEISLLPEVKRFLDLRLVSNLQSLSGSAAVTKVSAYFDG